MFSFKKLLRKNNSKPHSKVDPLAEKLRSLPDDLTMTILSRCIGTEGIETIGTGLFTLNIAIKKLISTSATIDNNFMQNKQIVPIREFFKEGEYLDLTNQLVLTFIRLSLIFLDTKYDKNNRVTLYYYNAINGVTNRLLELGGYAINGNEPP